MSLGTNIQYLRKLNKLTQEQFAERMNITRQTVSRWEADEVTPELGKLVEICSAFSCKLDELVRENMASKGVIFLLKDFTTEYLEYVKYYCLVLSENYIRNHFADIKGYANIIETRLDDEWCTMESVLEDNAEMLSLAQKHNVNYILINDEYEINIDL